MNSRIVKAFIVVIALYIGGTVSATDLPKQILLKNGSSFDIMYKKMPAEEIIYDKGKEVLYQNQIIKAGEGVVVPVRFKSGVMQLAIKRYGYGSSFSSWVTIPNPTDLAKEQLDMNQIQKYYTYTGVQGKLPIITVTTGYTGGWSFSIGYTN